MLLGNVMKVPHKIINHMDTWSALLPIVTSAFIEHTPTGSCLH